MERAVPVREERIMGRMPKEGSGPVGLHEVPNRKCVSPISRMAGIPAQIRYPAMPSTEATAEIPQKVKSQYIKESDRR